MIDFRHIASPLVFILFAVVVGPVLAFILVFVSHDWWWVLAWPVFTIGSTLLVFGFELLL